MANAPSTGKWRFVLIARVVGSTLDATTTRYYHFDALGSTRFLTDGSGTVTDTYTYDAWGKQTAGTGSTAQPYRFVGQLGYYSHYQDTNLFDQSGYQFLQLGVRMYDALLGRFTQVDRVKDMTRSTYLYCRADPLGFIDPSGMASVEMCYDPYFPLGSHAYICIGDKCYGFYPGESVTHGRGEVVDTDARKKNSKCYITCVSDKALACIKNHIQRDLREQDHYYAFHGLSSWGGVYNCVTWIVHVFTECGFKCPAVLAPAAIGNYATCIDPDGKECCK